MAVQGTFYRTETQRLGVTPVSPPQAVDDPVTPLNPPGSNPVHDPLTLGIPANGLSLIGQELSIGLASSGVTGALSGTDWNTFNNKVDASTLSNYQPISEKGQPNGYVPLDAGAKIQEIYLPDSITGQVEYIGTWNASTNSPTLADPPASTTKGHYYITTTAGTQFGIEFNVGDWIISNGSSWAKVDNTDAVTGVFGRLGNILAIESDYQEFYPRLSQTYANPTWISSLAWSKITGTPTTLSGYGITDAVPDTRTVTAGAGLTGGGALSANITISHADTSSQASVDNANGTVIQDVTLDTYGHVTALGSVNLDSRYVLKSGDTMTGMLTFNKTLSAGNAIIDFQQGYSLYSDNTGAGGNNTRLWFDTPNLGEVVIGPRSGASFLGNLRLRSNATSVEGTISVNTIANATGDFLTHVNGLINKRTPSQVLSDIGAQPAGSYVVTTRLINTGDGLTGGGDLSADRTISANFGTSAGTIAEGNDSRFHNAVSIGTANGLSLSTQVLSLDLSSSSTTGALSSTDWNTFNSKPSGSGTSGYISFWSSSTNLTGEINLFWESVGNRLGVLNSSPLATIHVGSRNINNSSRSQILISREITSSSGNDHAFSDSSLYSPTANNLAYNSYDARINIGGTADINHYAAFQDGTINNNTGTMANYWGYVSVPRTTNGTITNFQHIDIYNVSGSGTITNQYGIRIRELLLGSNNWAIYAEGNTRSYFGGSIGVGTVSPAKKLEIQTPNGTESSLRLRQLSQNFWDFKIPAGTSRLSIGDVSADYIHILTGGNTIFSNSATELTGGGRLQVNGTVNCNDPTADRHAVTRGWANANLAVLRTAGDATTGALRYAGTTRTAGQLYGGTTNPVSTTRLNYDGDLVSSTFYSEEIILNLSSLDTDVTVKTFNTTDKVVFIASVQPTGNISGSAVYSAYKGYDGTNSVFRVGVLGFASNINLNVDLTGSTLRARSTASNTVNAQIKVTIIYLNRT